MTNGQQVILVIGSTNAAKVAAIQELIQDYPLFSQAIIKSRVADSGVSSQPMSLEEIVQGAKNRAQNVFENCHYSVGLESGIFKLPDCDGKYMEACICAIFDDKQFHVGLSCGFILPPQQLNLIAKNNIDLGQAVYDAGLTDNRQLGAAEGIIGVLTKGRITRKHYTQQAFAMAMISLEN